MFGYLGFFSYIYSKLTLMKKSQLRKIIKEGDKGAMYQLIKLRDIENPYNLHRDFISSLNRFARATVAKEQGYQGFGLDNELQLTLLDANNQVAFHQFDKEEVKDTVKRAFELYRSTLAEGKLLKEEPQRKIPKEEEDAITDQIMREFGKIATTSTLTMDQKTVLDNNDYQSFISALNNLEILAKKYYKA